MLTFKAPRGWLEGEGLLKTLQQLDHLNPLSPLLNNKNRCNDASTFLNSTLKNKGERCFLALRGIYVASLYTYLDDLRKTNQSAFRDTCTPLYGFFEEIFFLVDFFEEKSRDVGRPPI